MKCEDGILIIMRIAKFCDCHFDYLHENVASPELMLSVNSHPWINLYNSGLIPQDKSKHTRFGSQDQVVMSLEIR